LLLSVIIPTHNPDAPRLRRTLTGLRAQSLPPDQWELIIVDNASAPALSLASLSDTAPANTRLIPEPQPGLTHARRRGFTEARGELIVLVDDDNVLSPDYLAQVAALFASHPTVGALGGRSIPEFERAPPAWWQPEFDGLIACRDLGNTPLTASGAREYPACAPIGAGMALRRAAAQTWLADPSAGALPDRRGNELTSGGDNDIILTVLAAGWAVAYFPSLALTHLIPAGRLEPHYLARLNRGIARSWMQVLRKHNVNPWPPVAGWTVPLRRIKAWFGNRAWSGPAAYIRWQGACGHFEGRTPPRTA
jgi:glycosyltransferase involved in cell wall biosynthesis